MYMKNCPKALKDQIFDENTYDIHGRFAIAYEDGLIDSPVGFAKKEYEKWLKNDYEAAKQIDEYIRGQLDKHGFKAVPLPKDGEDYDDDDSDDVDPTPVPKPDDPVVPDEPSDPVVPEPKPDDKPDEPVIPPQPDDDPVDPIEPDEPVVPDVKPDPKPEPVVPDVKPDPTPVVPDTKDDDKDKPKDPDDIKPHHHPEWWKYNEKDWKSHGSAKLDREKLENNVW